MIQIKRPFLSMKKKPEMLTLWHSLTSGRHACQDVWNCRGLEPRLWCSHNLLSDQNAVISSSWWPSLVLLMFWTDFLSFGEMFDLVYVNYCPSFLFFPISLERCKTKENINTSWLSIRWSNCFEFQWNFQDPSKSIEYQNQIWPAEP